MKQVLLIGLGGGLGSMLRYGVHVWSKHWWIGFPTGTLLVNLMGSLLIGILIGWSIKNTQPVYWFAVIGFCGGFTTYSTFAMDGIKLLQNQDWYGWSLYTLGSLVGGLVLCGVGLWIGSRL